MSDPFLLLILSSPSGAGKTTLRRKLSEKFPNLRFSVSHTTRTSRVTEQNGKDYHFITRPDFDELVARQAFLEWAEVHGNCYGTSRAEIDAAKSDAHCDGIIFDIDYQGARQIRAKVPEAVTIFILPPSMVELERRLKGRNSETPESAKRRLDGAKIEIEHYGFFDYLIVNDDIENAFRHLEGVILAERSKRHRRAELAERLLRADKL